MFRRLLLATTLALLPMTALADDTPTPAPNTTQSSVGPDVQGGQGSSSAAGGSNADAGSLQPATNSTLGGSSATDSAGLTAPNSDVLQAPNTNTDQLRVLLGNEADGAPNSPSADEAGDGNELLIDGLAIGFLVIATIAIVWIRRRQLAAARARFKAYV